MSWKFNVVLVIAAMSAVSCATMDRMPERAAAINHVVLLKLNDPEQAPALIKDCDDLLAPIPGVVSYFCGSPIDTGRTTVTADYDVGLYVGFDSVEDYLVYVEHPDHKTLVANWRDRLASLSVRDIHDRDPE